MMVRYSRFKGLPVISGEGTFQGRVLDVVLEPEGEDLVVRDLLVARGRLALLAARFQPRPPAVRVPASRIAAIDSRGVHLAPDVSLGPDAPVGPDAPPGTRHG